MTLQSIDNKIHTIRNTMVMLDFDLAKLYQVETRALKQSIKRNMDRFPNDFMFHLTKQEWQEVITNCDNLLETAKYSPSRPYAFTEQGVAMLSSILKSKTAILINISIMRTFVLFRRYATQHNDLDQKIRNLEEKFDQKFRDVHDVISYLLKQERLPDNEKNRNVIGYKL